MNIVIIAGAAAGALLLIALIVGVVVVMRKRAARNRVLESADDNLDDMTSRTTDGQQIDSGERSSGSYSDTPEYSRTGSGDPGVSRGDPGSWRDGHGDEDESYCGDYSA